VEDQPVEAPRDPRQEREAGRPYQRDAERDERNPTATESRMPFRQPHQGDAERDERPE
jgi:hypothetical protein